MFKKELSTGKESFKYYREKSKYRTVSNTPREVQHTRLINTFWRKVANRTIENKAGVYIEKFGYFCIGMSMERQLAPTPDKKDIYINPHTDNYRYYPLFIPDRNTMSFKVFTMDRNFSRKLKKKLQLKLKAGFKYLNYYRTIHRTLLIWNRNNNRKKFTDE